jgi:hypothetical protein
MLPLNPDSAVAIDSVAQGATLPQRSRWVTASKPISISGSVMASQLDNDESAEV